MKPCFWTARYAHVFLLALAFPAAVQSAADQAVLDAEDKIKAWAEASLPGDMGPGLSRRFEMGSYQPLPTDGLFTGLDPIEAGWIADLAGTYLDVAFQPCADDDVLFDLLMADADQLPFLEHCRQVIADYEALYGATHPAVRDRMRTYTSTLDPAVSNDRLTEVAYYDAAVLKSILEAADDPIARGGLADLTTAMVAVNSNYFFLKGIETEMRVGAGLPQLRDPEPADVRDAKYLALIRDGLLLLETAEFVPNWQFQRRVEYDDFLSRLNTTLMELLGTTGNLDEAQAAAAPMVANWRVRLGPEAEVLERTALYDVLRDVTDVLDALNVADMRDEAVEIGQRAVVLARRGDLPQTESLLLNMLQFDLRAEDAVVGTDGATVADRLELYPFDVTISMEPDVPFAFGEINNNHVPITLDCKADIETALQTRPADAETLEAMLNIWNGIEIEFSYGNLRDAVEPIELLDLSHQSLDPRIDSCALRIPELLARAYAGSSRLDEAQELYTELREAYRASPGPASYEYYRATLGLSEVLLSQGRVDQGMALTIEAMSIFDDAGVHNVYGFAELDTAPARASVAMTRYGRTDRALSFSQRAFELSRDQNGYFQGKSLPSLENFAAALANANQISRALEAHRIVASFGNDEEFLNMASTLLKANRSDIASRYAQYLFDLSMSSLNDPDSDLPEQNRLIRAWISASVLARVSVELGQYSDAIDLAGASLKGLVDLFGIESADVRELNLSQLRSAIRLGETDIATNLARVLLENEASVIDGLTIGEARTALLADLQTFAARAMLDYARTGGGETPEDQPDALRDEAFLTLQSGRVSPASEAVARNMARSSLADESLAPLFRDWSEGLQARDALRVEMMASTDRGELLGSGWFERSSELDEQIVAAEEALREAAPDLFDRAEPKPVGLNEIASPASGLLNEAEALVYLAPGAKEAPGIVFVASHNGIAWADVQISAEELAAEVAALHSQARAGMRAFVLDSAGAAPALFDVARAQALYAALFEDEALAGLLAQAHELVIVAKGPFLSLPFNALPVATVPDGDLRAVRWLGTEKALTILPDVASLTRRSVSVPAPADGARGFIAFADPDFGGASEKSTPLRTAEFTFDGRAVRGALDNLAPLPGTRREAEAMAEQYGTENTALFLSHRATETELFRLSATGALETAEVLLIATHGLIAGAADGVAEPALALTPPSGDGKIIELASFGSEFPLPGQPVDDGLLTASEAAMLRIDADWVILSACDTASGASPNAEGLSGLASGFLTAGAKSLLVSHWPVHDVAAERLTTFAVTTLRDDPSIGRAEAMRRSMLNMIEGAAGTENFAHPAYWAPFQVIGLD